MPGPKLERLAMAVAVLAPMLSAGGCQIDSTAGSPPSAAAQVGATDVQLAVENLPRRGKYL